MLKAPAVRIENLKKTYRTGTEALKGVSLTIPAGDFFALLGPNGAGKTSIISILCGLAVKTSGTAEVNGVSIDKDIDKAKSFIGLVPQEFNFNIFETVFDIVVNQAGYYGISRREAAPRAEQLLKDLGLWEKRNDQAQTLSGGMKRRLMIARALIHEPKILLLDEPTAGVDVELRLGMWKFLRELNADGTTIVLTTHYLEEAEQLCNRVAIINHGAIIREGTVKELITNASSVTLLLDLTAPVRSAELQLLRGYPVTKIDDTTLEICITHGQTANDALRKISSIGLGIANIRNTGSRLEEVFLELTQLSDESH